VCKHIRHEWTPGRSTASLLASLEAVQWLAWALRYWNKLPELVSPSSQPLCSTFLANVAAGLACNRTHTWAAGLCAALHFVCPAPIKTIWMWPTRSGCACRAAWQQSPGVCVLPRC
jgi:hypothetical protein